MHIAQWIAAHAVAEVLAGHNLTQALPQAMRKAAQATPQQQAAAQDYSYLTLRRYAEADALLQALTSRPLTDARIRALLLVALAQLLQQREDDFTVVNQAVEAAGKSKQRWAKGLVNAVLRNFVRQRAPLMAALAEQPMLQYNMPTWWIDLLKQQYPQHWTSLLETGNQHPPMTLRVNLRKTTTEAYLTTLQAAGLEARLLGETAIQLQHPVPVTQLPYFAEGWVSVQDAAAQWAAPLLNAQPGMRVLDACSAPGGKTGHLLERTEGLNVQALDSDAKRLQRVQDNLQRLGLSAQCQVGDAARDEWYDGQPFDRILADVPCSASGIVRRHVDMKWLRRPQDIASFARTQQQILANLWRMLAKDGTLMYVTCALFQQENDMQIQQFLTMHPDARRLPVTFTESALPCTLHVGGQLLPTAEHDGLFYALLHKG